MDGFLATGFADLDGHGAVGRFADCLRLLDRLPAMRAIKDESLRLLAPVPGARVLEAGCGLGGEARRLAQVVGPRGLILGLDASRAMLARAAAAGSPVAWVQADAGRLPLADGAVDACRVERMLQHVHDPGRVLAELARVTRSGGSVLALEPDWGTFVVDSVDRAVQRGLATFWCDSFRSGWVGRRLARHLAEAGLTGVTALGRTLVVRRLAEAEGIFDLEATLGRAVAAGRLSANQADAFRLELARAEAAGSFFAALTFFLVQGRRP